MKWIHEHIYTQSLVEQIFSSCLHTIPRITMHCTDQAWFEVIILREKSKPESIGVFIKSMDEYCKEIDWFLEHAYTQSLDEQTFSFCSHTIPPVTYLHRKLYLEQFLKDTEPRGIIQWTLNLHIFFFTCKVVETPLFNPLQLCHDQTSNRNSLLLKLASS